MTQIKQTVPASLTGKWKPYPAYKDSGVEWLGEIPGHWEVRRLKYLMKDMVAGPFGSSLTKDLYTERGYRVYGQEQVIPADFSIGDYYISKELYLTMRRYAVNTGDVLVSCVGTFGKVAVVPPEAEPGIINPRLAKLVPNKDAINPAYLGLLLGSQVAFEQMEQVSRGGTMGVINLSLLSELQLPLPPISIQHAILTYLDRETTKINALIAKKERLIELLQEKRATLISHAVTKGLDPTVPVKDSGIEWLGKIPAHWEVKRLKYTIQNGFVNGLFKKREQFGSGTKLVNVVNLYRDNLLIDFGSLDRVETEQQEYENFKVLSGDIFFVRSSLKLEGVGASASIVEVPEPTVFECHTVRIRPSLELVVPKYLINYLNSSLVRQKLITLAETTTMTTIAQPELAALEVIVPPIPEQHIIATYLDAETAKIDALISRIHEGIEKLKEYSAALISAAVTGKIDVREEIPLPGDRDL